MFHALSLMVKIFGLHCIIVSGSDSKSFFCYYILDYASLKIYYKTYPCICQFVKDCLKLVKYLYHDSNNAQSVLFDILLVVKQMAILLSNAPERMKINIYHKSKIQYLFFTTVIFIVKPFYTVITVLYLICFNIIKESSFVSLSCKC